MAALEMHMRSIPKVAFLLVPLLFATATASPQRTNDPIERIREADLKADLFALAGDQTRGREGGTIDELTASAWLAERAREAGMLPAGDNGTYFQFFPLERFRVSASSSVTLGRQDTPDGGGRRNGCPRARAGRCARDRPCGRSD